MLDLRRLRLLCELHRRGTITAVADALSYSPSAVSQQLATLERETGVQLLEPSGRRVRLTPQAQTLVEHAEVLLVQMERAEAALARAMTQTGGTLRVAAFQTAVVTLVPDALTRLGEEHPSLRVEVTELEPEVALPAMVAGEFDFVIAEEYPGRPLPLPRDTERTHLRHDELRLVTPTDWGARRLSDLAERPFVVEPPTTEAGQWALAACRTAGFEPDVRYVSSNLTTHLDLAHRGLAGALVPQLAGAERIPSLRISTLSGRPSREIFSAVRRGTAQHPAVLAFVDAIGS